MRDLSRRKPLPGPLAALVSTPARARAGAGGGDHDAIRSAVVRFEEANRVYAAAAAEWGRLADRVPMAKYDARTRDRESPTPEQIAARAYSDALLDPAILAVNAAWDDVETAILASGGQAVIVGGKFYRREEPHPSLRVDDLSGDAFADRVWPSGLVLDLDAIEQRDSDAWKRGKQW